MVENKEDVSEGISISPASMEKFAAAMKETPVLLLREALTMQPAIDQISTETIDKMDKLIKAAAGNGGCFIGCKGAMR